MRMAAVRHASLALAVLLVAVAAAPAGAAAVAAPNASAVAGATEAGPAALPEAGNVTDDAPTRHATPPDERRLDRSGGVPADANGRRTVQPRDLIVAVGGEDPPAAVERARENGRKTVKARDV